MKLKNKKWLTAKLLILPCLIFIVFITYYVYDRYDSIYEYRFYSNQIWAKGKYNLYGTLQFTRITFYFNKTQHMLGSPQTPTLKPEDISVKIDGKFYKLSDLSYGKIKKFRHTRYPRKAGKTATSDKQEIYIINLNDKGKIVSSIEFEYKGKVLEKLECWVDSNSTEPSPQFKYKESNAIMLPISLNRLKKSLPTSYYYGRLQTPLSGKLTTIFHKSES